MKLSHIMAIFVFLASGQGHAAGGSIAGNGGGIAEKNVLYAYANLDRFITICLNGSLCQLSDKERQALQAIRVDLPREQAKPDQIRFSSGKSQPGFFMIDGKIRVAKTGDHVGDPIYVNADLLYATRDDGRYTPIEIPMATSILVHELGHHHGIRDHAWLDALGTKLLVLVSKHTIRSEIWDGQISFIVIQFNSVHSDADEWTKINTLDQILIAYDDQLMNLTDWVRKSVKCPNPIDPVLGLRIYNLHEDHGAKHLSHMLQRPLSAWYIISCQPNKISDTGDLRFGLNLRRNPKTDAPEFVFEGSVFQQVSCKDDRQVCE